jgi:hypothetical protein
MVFAMVWKALTTLPFPLIAQMEHRQERLLSARTDQLQQHLAVGNQDKSPGVRLQRTAASFSPGLQVPDPLEIDLSKFIEIKGKLGGNTDDVENFLNIRNVLAAARTDAAATATGSGSAGGKTDTTGGTGDGKKTDAEIAQDLVNKQSLDKSFTVRLYQIGDCKI